MIKNKKNIEHEVEQSILIDSDAPSILAVENKINYFLRRRGSGTLSIIGRWGVGKTYFWRNCFHKHNSKNATSFKKYSYVSLFGINSIADLKTNIFTNTASIQSERNLCEWIKGFYWKIIKIFNPVRILILFKNLINITNRIIRKTIELYMHPFARKRFCYLCERKYCSFKINSKQILGYSRFKLSRIPDRLIEAQLHATIKNTIICLDDFERKEKKITAKMILGVINDLVEKSNCKFILILNKDSLDKKLKMEYAQYREKVIDIELYFDPPHDYCFDIACEISKSIAMPNVNNILLDKKLFNLLKNKLKELKVKNIRTIIKIIDHCNEIITKISNTNIIHQNDSLLQSYKINKDIIRICCICCSCYYDKSKNSPSIEFIQSNLERIYYEQSTNTISIKPLDVKYSTAEMQTNGISNSIIQENNNSQALKIMKKNKRQKKYISFLSKQKFPIDKLNTPYRNLLINLTIEAIKNGYVNEDFLPKQIQNITGQLNTIGEQQQVQQMHNKYKAAIMGIHSRFGDFDDDVDKQILNKIFDATKNAIGIEDAPSIAQTISILRKCKKEAWANELIELYITTNEDLISRWSSSDIDHIKNYCSMKSHDEKFISSLIISWENSAKNNTSDYNLFEAIIDAGRFLVKGGSLNEELRKILCKSSSNEIYKIIKNYRSEKHASGLGYLDGESDDFYAAIRMIVSRGNELRTDGCDPQSKVKEAIEKLAVRSSLNSIRIRKFFEDHDPSLD